MKRSTVEYTSHGYFISL